jgi:hypothetical protein
MVLGPRHLLRAGLFSPAGALAKNTARYPVIGEMTSNTP